MRDRKSRTLRRKREGKEARLLKQDPYLCGCGRPESEHELKEITRDEMLNLKPAPHYKKDHSEFMRKHFNIT